jgi:hypothetical protein
MTRRLPHKFFRPSSPRRLSVIGFATAISGHPPPPIPACPCPRPPILHACTHHPPLALRVQWHRACRGRRVCACPTVRLCVFECLAGFRFLPVSFQGDCPAPFMHPLPSSPTPFSSGCVCAAFLCRCARLRDTSCMWGGWELTARLFSFFHSSTTPSWTA